MQEEVVNIGTYSPQDAKLLKAQVEMWNRKRGQKVRVRLRARGPRNHKADLDTPHENATGYAVYLHVQCRSTLDMSWQQRVNARAYLVKVFKNDPDALEKILIRGCKGFANMTDQELLNELMDYLEVD